MKFEIGQKVKVMADHGSCHEFPIGEIVRITKIFEGSGYHFHAEYLDGSDWWALTDIEVCPV